MRNRASCLVMLLATACASDSDGQKAGDGGATDGALVLDAPRAAAASRFDARPAPDARPPADASMADAPPIGPQTACSAPLPLYDTSAPTAVVGSGSAASCTEALLRTAAMAGGTITFNCGASPATIAITQEIVLKVDRDTIIDGGGRVTLDAGGRARIFSFTHPDWMNNQKKVVLQRLTLRNGSAPLGTYFPQDPANPKCAYGYKDGSGGVIFMRNGVLHIIDSTFQDNRAALVGPDVGGGAVYVLGVPEVIIQGSRFIGNRAANAGAVGLLFSGRLQIVNTTFEDNTAEGLGANYVEPGCPNFNHDGQGGAGGNGGAVTFDGLNDDGAVVTLCGDTFRGNRANALAGALFRTPNAGVRDLRIDRSLFEANTAKQGGVTFIKQNRVVVRATTFTSNRGGVDIDGAAVSGGIGGLWINEGTLDMENSTFDDHAPSALDVEGSGTARNVTFVASRPNGSVTLSNSLIVNTSCSSARPGDHNLQWPSGTACAAGTTFADPAIGTLGDHGGLTPTFLPTAAVGGVGASCPSIDQRGEARNPSSCAAGSVEP